MDEWACYIIENRGYTYVGVSNNVKKGYVPITERYVGERSIQPVRERVGRTFAL